MGPHSTDEVPEAKEDIRSLSSSHRHTPNLPYMHKVGVPPKQNLFKEFKTTVKETFFADDPLRSFKDQSKSRKFILGIQAIFPILEWGRSYNLTKFRGDLIAGLTIASLCIPQDIGYAKLASLEPQYGLYSSFVPPLIYAFMGSSRDIAIGPVAVVSLLLGSLLRAEIDPTENPAEYLRLAFTATFFAGITQATLGFFRLGFLIDFLSHAAIVGFMGGAAITIALQQLKGFLGIKNFTKETDIISVMHSVWASVHHGWNWQTIVIGATFLGFLLFAKYIGKKNKKFFWVPAIAPLISVILSTFFVYITRADKKGVQIVKHIDKGINPSSASQIYFSGVYLLKGFKIGVVAGLIALTEAVAIGRTFASMKDYQLDGNKEMVALGAMNIVGSMTSCYVATEHLKKANLPRVQFLIVEMSPVTDIDTSGIHALEELHRSLLKRDVKLVLANPGQVVIDKLHASKFADDIGEDKIFLTVGDAEAVAIGRTFASMKDYQLDGNKEMVALGAMNIVGSMTSCYVATSDVRMDSTLQSLHSSDANLVPLLVYAFIGNLKTQLYDRYIFCWTTQATLGFLRQSTHASHGAQFIMNETGRL
ncbi:hypothetical protein VitviT2T_027174 [Vitis vinifera]|uniref:STAS domain-containing protein n=1 Tax=Vitis vinifera TaxID=29760 RepID=A0ABY9DRZ6_VITVI|nr:hypothetical protein VitviT2T_027174 [Vitis vinifera]